MKSAVAPGQTTPAADGPDPCRVAPPGIPARTSTETGGQQPARAPPDRRRGLGGRGAWERVPPLPAGEVPSAADGWLTGRLKRGTSPNPRAVRNAVTSAPATTVPSSGIGNHERREQSADPDHASGSARSAAPMARIRLSMTSCRTSRSRRCAERQTEGLSSRLRREARTKRRFRALTQAIREREGEQTDGGDHRFASSSLDRPDTSTLTRPPRRDVPETRLSPPAMTPSSPRRGRRDTVPHPATYRIKRLPGRCRGNDTFSSPTTIHESDRQPEVTPSSTGF
jgi:hypothetical protein